MRAALRAALAAGLGALLLCTSFGALAHKASDSYLRLDVRAGVVTGQIDLALRDLDFALGLDADGDGEITWGELRAQRDALAAWTLAGLTVQRGGPCTLTVGDLMVDEHSDGAYAVLPLSGTCSDPAAGGELTLGYRLLFEQDRLHRGLLRLDLDGGGTRSAVFSPTQPEQRFAPQTVSAGRQFLQYVVEGIWHIWIGFDHVLFLLALLLPAVLVHERRHGQRHWHGVANLRVAGREVLAVITSFTLAHSITLSLATLGLVSLPSRLIESVIALSVALAAVNNLRPWVEGRRWLAAFGFGLIHGFGFASVLADLGLPTNALVLSLLGFNVGVEFGQLVIVALFLPLAYRWRDTTFYRVGVFKVGSCATLALALVWLLERVLDLRLISA